MVELDEEKTARLYKQLKERRRTLIESREEKARSWQILQQPEVEPEETAQKEKLAMGMDQLDTQTKEEIEAIDRALGKMEQGGYGVCESCGGDISPERLEALPWAPFCIRCAAESENQGAESATGMTPGTPAGEAPQPLPADQELVEAVYDRLREDGRVDQDELRVYSRDNVLRLEGFVPNMAQHHILLEILEEMGIETIEDHLAEAPLLWQKKEKTASRSTPSKDQEETLLQGEDVQDEPFESLKAGTSTSPSGSLVPEKE